MDPELDELLDSALNDFEKNKQEKKQESIVDIQKTDDNAELPIDEEKLFHEIFNDEQTKESLKEFTDALQKNLNNQSNEDSNKILQDFEKMMSNIQLYEDDIDEDDDRPKTIKTSTSTASKISSTTDPLSKILDDMTKKSEQVLKNGGIPESLFSDLLKDDDDDTPLDESSSLLLQPLISMLFSKDILYPSLKLMKENYEKYLIDKKTILKEDELEKCTTQRNLIIEMCKVYENSKDTDSEEVKSAQLKTILDLLEKCGHPPAELVPDVNPFGGLGDMAKSNGCPTS